MFGYSFPASIFCALHKARRLTAVLLCCFMGACASINMGDSLQAIDTTPTGSIGLTDSLLAGIDPSDWQVLLARISAFDKGALGTGNATAEWSNPETGSKGRITQVEALPDLVNEECRSFKSSMHRVTGVENIAGQACRAPDGHWQITGFKTGVSV
ncbi:RT0821/Lpp0805 family surface protein [uncultured Cohaesibacter sp.]|uniref:RT0821/Lpp0805 family surface protein n=1 Tax=uncultured Cohaesibacter sp. TaxID=1002546 RepID=UPI00292DFD1A|nr:RT0821/Lpp0805 family surface protein [uncultured Cohaesibacter sp.]